MKAASQTNTIQMFCKKMLYFWRRMTVITMDVNSLSSVRVYYHGSYKMNSKPRRHRPQRYPVLEVNITMIHQVWRIYSSVWKASTLSLVRIINFCPDLMMKLNKIIYVTHPCQLFWPNSKRCRDGIRQAELQFKNVWSWTWCSSDFSAHNQHLTVFSISSKVTMS